MPQVKSKVKSQKSKTTGFSVPVYSLTGRAVGSMALPKEIFGAKINKNLLSQAIRVYETNQKSHFAKTKTRGEVRGSTAKIYKQKGTGRARHGSIRAPIFVGGGIVFGPEPRKVRLELPQKMKKQALISALSAKMIDKQILGLSGLDKASGKTKEIAKLLDKLSVKNGLIVTSEKNVFRAVRNISGIFCQAVNQLNAFSVLKYQKLFFTKEALEVLQK